MSQSQDSLHRSISGLDLAADMLYLPCIVEEQMQVKNAPGEGEELLTIFFQFD